MQILLAISTLCFLALVWALIAVTRHIRAGRNALPPQETFAQHLLQASAQDNQLRTRTIPEQNIRDITTRKSWNQLPETVTARPRAEREKGPSEPLAARRKPPQPSSQGSIERLDWAYFNKDFGDHTDPYQTPRIRANSRNY